MSETAPSIAIPVAVVGSVPAVMSEYDKLDASFKAEIANLRSDLKLSPNAKYYFGALVVSVAAWYGILHFVACVF